MKIINQVLTLGCFFALLTPNFADRAPPREASEASRDEIQKIVDKIVSKLSFQEGIIDLEGIATLKLPPGYRYLNPADTRVVLEDLWGNPSRNYTLGMFFPPKVGPLQDGWSVILSYSDEGYVKDDDAFSIQANALLREMKEPMREENEHRLREGFEPIELVGWALPPRYERESHKLIWAKELKLGSVLESTRKYNIRSLSPPQYDKESHKLFWTKQLKLGSNRNNILNYNIRVLGRKGVLVLNAIDDMENLQEIEKLTPELLSFVDFTDGNRYADFNPNTDKVAAYGVAGLIAEAVIDKTISSKTHWLDFPGWKTGVWTIFGLAIIGGVVIKLVQSARRRRQPPK
jgi:uncharacterized membrane-anchored protein